MSQIIWTALLIAVLLFIPDDCMSRSVRSPKTTETKKKQMLSKNGYYASDMLSEQEYEREHQKQRQSLGIFMLPKRYLRSSIENEEQKRKLKTMLSKKLEMMKNYLKTESKSDLESLKDNYLNEKGSIKKYNTEHPNNLQSEPISNTIMDYGVLPEIISQVKTLSDNILTLTAPQTYATKQMSKMQPNPEAKRESVLEILDHYPKNQKSIYLQDLRPIAKYKTEHPTLQEILSSLNKAIQSETSSEDEDSVLRVPDLKSYDIMIKFQSMVLPNRKSPNDTKRTVGRCGNSRRDDKNGQNGDTTTICYTYPNYYYYPTYYYPYYYPYYPYYYWGRR